MRSGRRAHLTSAESVFPLGKRFPNDCGCDEFSWWEPMPYTLGGLRSGSYKLGIAPWYPEGGHWSDTPPPETIWSRGPSAGKTLRS